jgi:hypothetical protein
VQVKILEFQEQPGETSDIIVDYLKQILTKNELTSKIMAFVGTILTAILEEKIEKELITFMQN